MLNAFLLVLDRDTPPLVRHDTTPGMSPSNVLFALHVTSYVSTHINGSWSMPAAPGTLAVWASPVTPGT